MQLYRHVEDYFYLFPGENIAVYKQPQATSVYRYRIVKLAVWSLPALRHVSTEGRVFDRSANVFEEAYISLRDFEKLPEEYSRIYQIDDYFRVAVELERLAKLV